MNSLIKVTFFGLLMASNALQASESPTPAQPNDQQKNSSKSSVFMQRTKNTATYLSNGLKNNWRIAVGTTVATAVGSGIVYALKARYGVNIPAASAIGGGLQVATHRPLQQEYVMPVVKVLGNTVGDVVQVFKSRRLQAARITESYAAIRPAIRQEVSTAIILHATDRVGTYPILAAAADPVTNLIMTYATGAPF